MQNPPPGSLIGLSAPDLLEARNATYRVLPDRRVLYAAAKIHHILQGAPLRSVLVRFERSGWTIGYGDEVVGRLPEIPTWEESRSFLEAWASRIGPSWKSPSKKVNEGTMRSLRATLSDESAADVASALVRLNGLWKDSPGNPELLRAACGGLAWLQIQTHDPLERTDPLLGHALALLVVAKRSGIDMTREEALLAGEMGYGAAAAVAGRALPPDDPVRFFETHDDRGLKALAEKTHGRRAEYLALLRLGEAGDSVVWNEFRSRTHWSGAETSPVLHAAMALGDFSQTASRGHQIFQGALEEAGVQAAASLAPPPEARLKEFERNLERRREQVGGPLFDHDSAVSVSRANAYSGLYEIASFALDMYSSVEAASSFSSTLVDVPPGTAEELVQWITDRIAVREGEAKGKSRALVDVASFRELGFRPTSKLCSALGYSANTPLDTSLRRRIPGYFAGLDTRPLHLREVGWTSWNNLIDLGRGERYLRAFVAIAPHEAGTYLPWCARLDGGVDELRSIADRSDLTTATRTHALEDVAWLAGSGAMDRDFLETRYRRLLEEDRESTTALSALVKLLERSGKTERANETIKEFLANRSDNNDLVWAEVEARRARLLRRAGRLDEAWAAVEPTLVTGKGDCLDEGARTLAALGDSRRARELAADALQRYRSSGPAAALVVELDWRSGSYAEAASVLAAHDKYLTEDDWQTDINRAFARTFEKKPVEEATRAFEEVRKAIPRHWTLGNLALNLGTRGGHEAAFRMLASLGGRDTEAMGLLLSAYGELVKARGAPEAVEWLKGRLPAGDPGNSFLLASFQEGHYDLLWDLFKDRSAPNLTVLQALRGFALYLSKIDSGPRCDAVFAYWAANASDDFAMGGRYLFGIGGVDRAALLSGVKNDEDLAGVAFTIGLKAAREGSNEEAAEWFQVALEVGTERMAPSAWAWRFLTNWTAKETFLTSAAARKVTLPFRLARTKAVLDED